MTDFNSVPTNGASKNLSKPKNIDNNDYSKQTKIIDLLTQLDRKEFIANPNYRTEIYTKIMDSQNLNKNYGWFSFYHQPYTRGAVFALMALYNVINAKGSSGDAVNSATKPSEPTALELQNFIDTYFGNEASSTFTGVLIQDYINDFNSKETKTSHGGQKYNLTDIKNAYNPAQKKSYFNDQLDSQPSTNTNSLNRNLNSSQVTNDQTNNTIQQLIQQATTLIKDMSDIHSRVQPPANVY